MGSGLQPPGEAPDPAKQLASPQAVGHKGGGGGRAPGRLSPHAGGGVVRVRRPALPLQAADQRHGRRDGQRQGEAGAGPAGILQEPAVPSGRGGVFHGEPRGPGLRRGCLFWLLSAPGGGGLTAGGGWAGPKQRSQRGLARRSWEATFASTGKRRP